MKKAVIGIITTTLLFGIISPAFAQNPNNNKTQEIRRELRRDLKEERRDAKKDLKEERRDAKQESNAQQNADKAKLKNATLTAIDTAMQKLTLTLDGKTYTASVTAETKIRRQYGGQSSFAELAVGNMLDVRGTWTNAEKTELTAMNIRNRSVSRLRGTFIGDVLSINGNTIVIQTKNRGNQTATVAATTKFVNREMTPITLADIVIGHRIRVKGVWDKSNNTVSQITQVKNFSLPPKTDPTATPTPTNTPTPAP